MSLGTIQCLKGQVKYVLVYKNSDEVLSRLKSRGFRMTSLSIHDFSTLYTTLLQNLIKEKKLLDLIERAYKNEGTLYLATCINETAFFTSTDHRRYILFDLVRMYVTPYRIFITSDLVISYTDKLLVI